MIDYCKNEYNTYVERMKTFGDIYNKDTEAGVKHVTGYGSQSCAWRYVKIHGAVIRMGGWANFSHYVNKCAESDYLVFKAYEKQIKELKNEVTQLKKKLKG